MDMDITAEEKPSVTEPDGSAGPDGASDATWCREIAARIAVGDTLAESLLVERLRPGLRMLLFARCAQDRELAADLCQETLVIVLKRLRERTMDNPARVAAFAAQTARQLAFDSRRRYAARKTVVDSAAVDAAALESPPDHSVDQDSIASLVRNLLAELSHDRDREILRRFYLLEQDKAEICQSFGLASGAFDQVVFRARARLRAMLEARGVASRDLLCVVGIWVPKSWLH